MSALLEELETLEDIYPQTFKGLFSLKYISKLNIKQVPICHKLIVLSKDASNPKFRIRVCPEIEENPNKNTFVGLNITFSFSDSYPFKAPIISFEATNAMKQTLQSFYHTFKDNEEMLCLNKSQHHSLTASINEYYQETGAEDRTLYEIITKIQEWVEDNNKPPSSDTFDVNGPSTKPKNKNIEQKSDEKESENRPKILMLHAYKQNGKIFRHRSKKFVNELLRKFDLFFPNAPFNLNGTKDCPNPFCWYKYPKVDDKDDDNEEQTNLSKLLVNHEMCPYIHFFELLIYIFKYLNKTKSEFIGIIAFSQGATLSTILVWLSTLSDEEFERLIADKLSHKHEKEMTLHGLFKKHGNVFNRYLKIKAVCLMGAHLYPLPEQLKPSYVDFVRFCKKGQRQNNDETWNKLQCYSLHTMAKNDEWVTMDKSEDLLDLFDKKEIIQHNNGHRIYNNKYVAEWMIKHCLT